jgi:hypothetical protein
MTLVTQLAPTHARNAQTSKQRDSERAAADFSQKTPSEINHPPRGWMYPVCHTGNKSTKVARGGCV